MRRLKVKHRWVTMELMNSIARLEIEQIDGQYEFVKYYTSFGRTERQILNKQEIYYNTTRELLDILTRNIADELVSRNKITATYKVRFTTDADPGGWRLERYEINRHESGDYSLFQQAGDRNTGGYRIDMINPDAFTETDYSEFLKWIPHCGIKHEDLLADEGLKEFVGYGQKEDSRQN